MKVSAKEIATNLGIAQSTVYSLARQKKIPHLRIGQRVVFDLAAVEEALRVPAETDQPSLGGGKGRSQVAVNE
jgi:excisionase family DNA binding protein